MTSKTKLMRAIGGPGIALLLCLWISTNAPRATWYLAMGQLAVGLMLYWVARTAAARIRS